MLRIDLFMTEEGGGSAVRTFQQRGWGYAEYAGQTVEHIVGYRHLAIFILAEGYAAHADTIGHLALIKA